MLDPNPKLRSEAEWRELLNELIASLSTFTGIRFQSTSWIVRDDQPGYACGAGSVNVRGVVNPALRLEACGVVSVTVNFGEAAWASCDLLLFSDGKRILGPEGRDFMFLPYSEAGWSHRGWMLDDYGEWESHKTDAWWS